MKIENMTAREHIKKARKIIMDAKANMKEVGRMKKSSQRGAPDYPAFWDAIMALWYLEMAESYCKEEKL